MPCNQPRRRLTTEQVVDGRPRGIDYTNTTGIWQTVWLEPVPSMRIEELRISALGDESFEVWVCLHAPSTGWLVEAELGDRDELVTRASAPDAGAAVRLRLPVPPEWVRRWSPDDPYLYDLRVRLLDDARLLDEVQAYAGLRTVTLRDGRFELNGEPLCLRLALDRAYRPQGLLAAPPDEALREDVEWAKRLGFNGVRKHQKVEDWCDRLGLLVWGAAHRALLVDAGRGGDAGRVGARGAARCEPPLHHHPGARERRSIPRSSPPCTAGCSANRRKRSKKPRDCLGRTSDGARRLRPPSAWAAVTSPSGSLRTRMTRVLRRTDYLERLALPFGSTCGFCCRGMYGAPRIHAELTDPDGSYQLRCGRKWVARLMRLAAVVGRHRRGAGHDHR